MNETVKIALPPQGSVIRKLLINLMTYIYTIDSIRDVELEGNYIKLHVTSRKDFLTDLNSSLRDIGEIVGKDLENNKIRDFKIHLNDRRSFKSMLNNMATDYLFTNIVRILREANLSLESLNELEIAKSNGKGRIRIVLGSDRLALPLEVFYERYQSRYEFPKGRGGKPFDVRLSPAWFTILMAGLALSYINSFGAEYVLAFVTEDTFARVVRDPTARAIIYGSRYGILSILRDRNVPPRPHIPFVLYISSEIVKEVRDNVELLKELINIKPTLEIDRVNRTGKSFTLQERLSLDVSPFLEKMLKLDTDVLEWISRNARKCIYSLGTGAVYGKYVTLSNKIYEALIGVGDPEEAAIYAMRSIAEYEAEKATDFRKVLRYHSSKVKKFVKARKYGHESVS